MLNRHIYICIYFQVISFFGHSDSRNYSKTKLSIVRVFNWSRYKRKQINIDKNEYEIKDTLPAKYVGLMPTNAKICMKYGGSLLSVLFTISTFYICNIYFSKKR